MQWNAEQAETIAKLEDFCGAAIPRSQFVLAGLAGTGKTTLVSSLVKSLCEQGMKVAMLAPTGKAAAVLNSKQTYVKAQTIHSFLYRAPNDAMAQLLDLIEEVDAQLSRAPDDHVLKARAQELQVKLETTYAQKNRLTFIKRDPEEFAGLAHVIFVDEASMVGADLVSDLAQVPAAIVYLGDPNQLYPVGAQQFSVPLLQPNAKLTQIMRQAGDSPILPLSRIILQNKALPRVWQPEYTVPRFKGTNPLAVVDKLGHVPQFIAYTNKTRRQAARTIRESLFGKDIDRAMPYLPVVGEWLMVDGNDRQIGLLKGDMLQVKEVTPAPVQNKVGRYTALVKAVDKRGVERNVWVHLNDLMLTMNHPFGLEQTYGARSTGENSDYKYVIIANKESLAVMFPYAITCHKAQGSEWESVALYNEGRPEQRTQYLYTGVTRAQETLSLLGVLT